MPRTCARARPGIALELAGRVLIVALALAACVGLAVGLLGGGGSILTVPILTYVVGLGATSAITCALVVVGATSAVALVPHAMAGRVRWGTGLLFGPAGMAGAYVGGTIGTRLAEPVVMTLFGLMMAASAWGMLRRRRAVPPTPPPTPSLARIILLGAVVGLMTGLVGAGGGFVIVPALVLVVGLSMHQAIGTSLLVIAMNSAAGLAGRLPHVEIDWGLTLTITAVAVVASLLGSRAVGRVSQQALRRGFGWLVVAMAALVLLEQVLP
jgi:uncharacterized protein